MLSISEIQNFIDEDMASNKKTLAKKGVSYYEGRHDIKDYRIFYFNNEGELVEDDTRSNIKISHPFFTELIDQCSQYMLSGHDRYVKSDNQDLQALLDEYFDDDFKGELNDLITFTKVEGDSFLYRYIDENMKTRFKFADGLNVVEIQGKYTSDKKDYVIYYYANGKEKDKDVTAIQVWNDTQVGYYTMIDNVIEKDKSIKPNPTYHVIYHDKNKTLYDTFGDVPFLRLDNNRKRTSDLFVIKDLIDDYDLMSCGLSNNLQDFAEGIYVVKNWQGDNLDELTYNVKRKKQVSVGEGGDLDIKTINIPYQARLTKMEVNEKNIYRFGMGLNTSTVADGNVTNYNIRTRYSLLELKCYKLEAQLRKLMKKIIKIVVDEINKDNKTNYQYKDVYCDFEREVMTNATENAQIELLEAQKKQVEISTLLGINAQIGDDVLLERICEVLDLDYNDVKAKIKENAPIDLNRMSEDILNTEVEDEESTQGNREPII